MINNRKLKSFHSCGPGPTRHVPMRANLSVRWYSNSRRGFRSTKTWEATSPAPMMRPKNFYFKIIRNSCFGGSPDIYFPSQGFVGVHTFDLKIGGFARLFRLQLSNIFRQNSSHSILSKNFLRLLRCWTNE